MTKSTEPPVFQWDGYRWSTQIAFREWPKNLTAHVEVVPPGTSASGEPAPPSEEQARALAFLGSREAKLGAVLLAAAKDWHALAVKRGYENQDGTPLRPLRSPRALNGLVELSTIHVHAIVKAKRAYVGLEFDCAWEREHGFGVMLHGRKIIRAGGADNALLEWIATGDGGQVLGEEKPRKPVRGVKAPGPMKAKPLAAGAKKAKPAAKKPAAKKAKPAAKKPAAKKPAAKQAKPAAKKPAAKKPAAKQAKPAAKKPAAKKPAAKQAKPATKVR